MTRFETTRLLYAPGVNDFQMLNVRDCFLSLLQLFGNELNRHHDGPQPPRLVFCQLNRQAVSCDCGFFSAHLHIHLEDASIERTS